MGTVSRVHTFASGAVLTAAQLNNEFDNLLTSSAINGGLDATNLGVTAGQITASKAIVVDGSRNLDDGTTSNQINNLVLSGTLTVAGATTQTGALSIDDTTDSTSTTTGSIHTDGGVGIAKDLIVGNDVKLLTDSAVLSLGVGSDATLTHDGTTGLTIAANPVIVDSGDALTLDAHTGIHIFKDAGTEVLRFTEGNSGDVTIKLATNGKDLIFTDHGDATGLKVLDAAAGINVPGEVQTTKIAYTDGDDAITIADGGGVTTSGTFESGGAATLASLVCTAAGTFGGGYGATGATISTAGVGQFNGALTTDGVFTAASLDISGNADIDGTLEADAITLNGTALGSLYSPIAGSTSIVTVGTIGTGTWQGTKVASAYLDDQTAHLNTTQSFTGAKTFGAATQFNSTVTVGVDDTGYDVQLFGATSGSSLLWDQSADDLIFTNAGIAVGSDATGDIYYRNSSGFLARLGASTDGHVLTTGGAGTIPAWEALPGGGTFSGPGSSTDNAVVRFNGTGGATGQNSGVTIDDSNNATGFANLTLSGELDAATGDFSGDVNVAGEVQTASIGYTDGDNAMTIADGGGVTFPQAATFTSGFSNNDQDITNVGNIALDSISSDAGTSIAVTLGTDAGDDLLVATDMLVVEGDTGYVGVGTTAPGGWATDADQQLFVIHNSDTTDGNSSCELALSVAQAASWNAITFTNGAKGHDSAEGQILYSHGSNYMQFDTNATERMRIDSAGNIMAGGTTSTYNASFGAANDVFVDIGGAGGGAVEFTRGADANATWIGGIHFANTNNSSTSNNANGYGIASILGEVVTTDSNAHDDSGGSIVFYTKTEAAASAERMRIDANGRVNNEANPVTAGNGAVGFYNNQNGQMTATIANTHTSGDPLILDLDFSGRAADNNTGWFLRCQDSSAARMYVYSDGDVWTSDAGTLTSDERLKNNIVDATDKLADVMRLKVRNFEWNTDYHPAKGGEKKLGFIAQELETVFPSLITEHDVARDNKIEEELYTADDDTQYYVDGDELPDGKEVGDVKNESQIPDGKEIGDIKIAGKAHEPTMRKAYKNAFAPILVKALQEVTVRLEAAEAKIATLESA